MEPLYRIPNWDEKYENNRSREIKKLRWYLCPNHFDSDGYLTLVDHPDGAAHFGAWRAIQATASRCSPRGTLIQGSGDPHTVESLSRKTKLPGPVFDAVLPRLLAIGWLEALNPVTQEVMRIPQEGAAKVRQSRRKVPLTYRRKEEKEEKESAPPERLGGGPPSPPGKRNEIWDTLSEVFHLQADTRAEKARLGKLATDYKVKSATPAKIRAMVEQYHQHPTFRSCACTADAVLKHWGELEHEAGKASRAAVDRARAQESRSRERDESTREKVARFARLAEIPQDELPTVLDAACKLMLIQAAAAPSDWRNKAMWVTAVLKAWDARK